MPNFETDKIGYKYRKYYICGWSDDIQSIVLLCVVTENVKVVELMHKVQNFSCA